MIRCLKISCSRDKIAPEPKKVVLNVSLFSFKVLFFYGHQLSSLFDKRQLSCYSHTHQPQITNQYHFSQMQEFLVVRSSAIYDFQANQVSPHSTCLKMGSTETIGNANHFYSQSQSKPFGRRLSCDSARMRTFGSAGSAA